MVTHNAVTLFPSGPAQSPLAVWALHRVVATMASDHQSFAYARLGNRALTLAAQIRSLTDMPLTEWVLNRTTQRL